MNALMITLYALSVIFGLVMLLSISWATVTQSIEYLVIFAVSMFLFAGAFYHANKIHEQLNHSNVATTVCVTEVVNACSDEHELKEVCKSETLDR